MAINTTLVDHPVVADALTRIRDRDTPNALFRQNLERIGTLLLAEATRSLPTVDGTVETPLTTAPARRIATQPVVVPILRKTSPIMPSSPFCEQTCAAKRSRRKESA